MPNMQSALIIDDDEVVRNLVRSYFDGFVADVDEAEDGESGWEKLQSNNYDLIVLDWKLPRLAGMALYNRIRSLDNYRLTPVVVISGYIERFDFRLLQEFPVTTLVEKPFTRGLFGSATKKLFDESEWYAKNERNVMALMEAVKFEEKRAINLVKDMVKKAPNPIPLGMMAGRHMFASGERRTAEKIFELLHKHDPSSVVVMNELAKVYHAKGQHKKALDLLHSANRVSPQNVQRLCLTGEIELNLRDPDGARDCFAKALDIDPDERVAQSGIVISENMSEMMNAPEADRIPKSFASMLNNLGIAYVKSGDFKKGIEQYESALAFLRTDFDNARLAFNLGLGYMRWGKPDKALPWFERSADLGEGKFTRSRNFLRQLRLDGVGQPDLLEEESLLENAAQTEPEAPADVPAIETSDDPAPSEAAGNYTFDNTGEEPGDLFDDEDDEEESIAV